MRNSYKWILTLKIIISVRFPDSYSVMDHLHILILLYDLYFFLYFIPLLSLSFILSSFLPFWFQFYSRSLFSLKYSFNIYNCNSQKLYTVYQSKWEFVLFIFLNISSHYFTFIHLRGKYICYVYIECLCRIVNVSHLSSISKRTFPRKVHWNISCNYATNKW